MPIHTPVDPVDGERRCFHISDSDHLKTRASERGGPWEAVVTDTETGKSYRVKDRDCGLGCRCDAEIVERL